MTSARATIELINPSAFRSYGTVKRVAPAERARSQNSSANDGVAKGRVTRIAAGQPVRSLNAAGSLLQTGPLLAAQTAGTAAISDLQAAPHAGVPSQQGVQAYRLVNGDVPGPVSILVDWEL